MAIRWHVHAPEHLTTVPLLIWLRGTDRGELLIRSRHQKDLIASAFDVQHITDAFDHDNGQDPTGCEDGTEIPGGADAQAPALLPRSAGALAGANTQAALRPCPNNRKTSASAASARATKGVRVFAAFGCSFDATGARWRRVSGAEDGTVDALFAFTETETGVDIGCPPVTDGSLVLHAIGR